MTCPTRWLVEGVLTVVTPLHIGDGGITHHPNLKEQNRDSAGGDGGLVEINRVTVDVNGRPYLPSTALRGALRRVLDRGGCSAETVSRLLGSEKLGSPVEVWDALVMDPGIVPASPPPYWRAARLTGVAAHVALDRRTRTAADERLFYEELVPPGVEFNVGILGTLGDDDVVTLLAVLESLGDGAVRIGANTHAGWGRLGWRLTCVRRMGPADVGGWLGDKSRPIAVRAFPPLPAQEQATLVAAARKEAASLSAAHRRSLVLELELTFDSHFLVNDRSRTGKGDLPDHAPMLDERGEPYLPASSFHGALRAQAERIVRTVHGEQACCGQGTARSSCKDVAGVDVFESPDEPCLVCRLFGAPGWATTLDASDFRSDVRVTMEHQDFAALDRFAGGVAGSKKFDACAAYQPSLKGTLSVDLTRLARTGAATRALGLLTLALRDLIEGDITFGFGAAKGYGACRAKVVGMSVPAADRLPGALAAALSRVESTSDPAALATAASVHEATLLNWIGSFEQAVTPASR